MGVMSGTLDLVQRSFAGAQIHDGRLYFEPRLPAHLDRLSFPMQVEGTPMRVTIEDGWLTLSAHPEGMSEPISVAVGGAVCELRPGDSCSFDLTAGLETARG